MIRSKRFVVRLAVLMAAGLLLTVGAFGDEKRPVRASYLSKDAIEIPTKQVLAARTAPTEANPRVQPGQLRWHADFTAACEAAKKSRKPVLLFQMMGKLDDQFC